MATKSKKRNNVFTAKFLSEVGQIASAGIPLTEKQAAGYLQRSAATLSVWRCTGRGPRSSGGRYTKADLDAWLATCPKKQVSPRVGRPVGSGKRGAR
jgi:hypothetical protein